jgi:hypothetical protein
MAAGQSVSHLLAQRDRIDLPPNSTIYVAEGILFIAIPSGPNKTEIRRVSLPRPNTPATVFDSVILSINAHSLTFGPDLSCVARPATGNAWFGQFTSSSNPTFRELIPTDFPQLVAVHVFNNQLCVFHATSAFIYIPYPIPGDPLTRAMKAEHPVSYTFHFRPVPRSGFCLHLVQEWCCACSVCSD